jgi:hypothetical protein
VNEEALAQWGISRQKQTKYVTENNLGTGEVHVQEKRHIGGVGGYVPTLISNPATRLS